jgi:TPP-dependent 2-oxoacid decarboxylase
VVDIVRKEIIYPMEFFETTTPDVSETMKKFSKKYSIPVSCSLAAKGLFDESSPLYAGVSDSFGHGSAEYDIKNRTALSRSEMISVHSIRSNTINR